MAKYDVESLETDLLGLIQDNLETKLDEIETEKGDGISIIAPLASEYFNSTDIAVDNNRFWMFYGVVDGTVDNIGPGSAEINRYMFLAYFNELNVGASIVRKKCLRMIRALKEIIEENFRNIPMASLLKIGTIAPTSASWEENESSPIYKVGGIYIETIIAG